MVRTTFDYFTMEKAIGVMELEARYRGWMMKPEQYEQFYTKLLEKNIAL